MAGPLRLKTNEPYATTPITDETHTVGEDVANEVFLDDAPLPGGAVTVVDPAGPTTYTRVVGTPAATEYRLEEETGRLVFNAANNGTALEIDYTSIGPRVLARDINRAYSRLNGDEPAEGSVWTTEVEVAAAANIELDPFTENVVYILLDANIQLDDFSTLPAGMTGLIALEQDGTGSRTVTFDTAWRQIGSGTVASAAGAATLVSWYVTGTGEIWYTIVSE